MNRNESPRVSIKLYEMIKDILITKSLVENYSTDFVDSLTGDDEILNLNLILVENRYYFKGYPSGNILKIFCKVLEIWGNYDYFPINFVKVDGINDQTATSVDKLNNQSCALNSIINSLKENNTQTAYKHFINFLESIGIRGFLTIVGVRSTQGSCECGLMKKEDLFKSFNTVYKRDKVLDKKEENKYTTKITVGARALSKHSDRTKDNFWGEMNGSELERNAKANQMFNKLMDECVWINIHYLPHSNKILEIRNTNGYGIRWSLNGEFRGFIEPEHIKDGATKKSKIDL